MIANMLQCGQQIITHKVLCNQIMTLLAINKIHTDIGIHIKFNKRMATSVGEISYNKSSTMQVNNIHQLVYQN